jgi:hypothetical protein
MVIVGDDCALPPPPRGPLGRRGLAGTLFVHKVLMPFFKATICLLASCTEFCESFLTDNNIKICHLDESVEKCSSGALRASIRQMCIANGTYANVTCLTKIV